MLFPRKVFYLSDCFLLVIINPERIVLMVDVKNKEMKNFPGRNANDFDFELLRKTFKHRLNVWF